MNEAETCRQQVVPLLQGSRYMRQFYMAFPPSWSHQILLIGKAHPMKLGALLPAVLDRAFKGEL